MSLPFYGLYAKQVLGAPGAMVGVYVAVRAGALLLLNLPWGWLSDRRGNRLVLQLMSAGSGLTVLLALGLVALVTVLPAEAVWLPYLAFPLFILDGAMRPAQMLVGGNYLLELVPEMDRPLYLGLSSTLTGVAVLLSGFGGLLVDVGGFVALFGVSLALYGTAFLLARGLPEPRDLVARGPEPAAPKSSNRFH
jgi:MFS family permease